MHLAWTSVVDSLWMLSQLGQINIQIDKKAWTGQHAYLKHFNSSLQMVIIIKINVSVLYVE